VANISVGKKPRYLSSGPSTFMKEVTDEIAANKARNAKNEKEMEDALYEFDEETEDKGSD
jgi:hypothetical protein